MTLLLTWNTYFLRLHNVDYESANGVCCTIVGGHIFTATNAIFILHGDEGSKFVK